MRNEQAFHKIISGMKKRGKKIKSRNVKPLFSSGILFDSPKINSIPKPQSDVPSQIENKDNIKDELKGFKETIEKMVKNIISNTNVSSTTNTYNTKNLTTNNKVFNVGGRINKNYTNSNTTNIKNNHTKNNEITNTHNANSLNQLRLFKNINQSNFIAKTSGTSNYLITSTRNKNENSSLNFVTNGDTNRTLSMNTVKTDGTKNFNNVVTQNKYVKPIQEKADGGWITGSLKGYPVSLDGKKVDFIGHGTEYVANKPSSSFVIPVDTPETRKNPKLTEKRMNEAKRAGFKLPDIINKKPVEIKKPKIEVKPLPVMSASLPQKGFGGILSGIGSAVGGVMENSPLAGIKDSIGGLLQNPIVSGVKDSIGGFVEKSPLGKLNSMVSSGIEKVTGVNPKETITNLFKSDSSESKLEKQVTENNMVKNESEKISETSKKEMTPLAIPVGSNNTARSDSKGMGTIPTGGDNNFVRIAKEKTMFPNWRTTMG
jgi:hypothetical protein